MEFKEPNEVGRESEGAMEGGRERGRKRERKEE